MFTIERDVCWMHCPRGLHPEFVLDHIEEDGTEVYLIRPGFYTDKIPPTPTPFPRNP